MIIDGAVAITGAASGIGRALAFDAVERGATAIAVIDLDADAAAQTATELSANVPAIAYQCDVSDVDAVEEAAARVQADLGVPSLVCANAGASPPVGPILDSHPRDFAWTLDTNVVGTWATLRAFGRHLITTDRRSWLLVTGSEHSVGVPFPGQGAYTASKHAVLAIADVLRLELPAHVGISVVVPGLVASGFWRALERRPARYGGPTGDPDLRLRAVMDEGMPADDVAGLALDGVEREEFLIGTHAHVRDYAARRHTEITRAFDQLEHLHPATRSSAVPDVIAALSHKSGALDQ